MPRHLKERKMKLSVTVAMLFVMTFIAGSCRDDVNSENKSGCQSCINDYCDCVDGVSDLQVISDCSNEAESCVSAECSSEEAQNLDYTSCGDSYGSDQNTSTDISGDAAVCQECIDVACTCMENAGTDADLSMACAQTLTTCMTSACDGVLETQLDTSCVDDLFS